MKQWLIISGLFLLVVCFISGITDHIPKPEYIPASEQRTGNAEAGYQYLVTGDYLKSGLPYGYFKLLNGSDKHNYLHREGKNALVPPGFNVVKADNGTTVVVPTCLQCHAQMLNDSLVVGLGNTELDFSHFDKQRPFLQQLANRIMQTFTPNQYKATIPIYRSMTTIAPLMRTEVPGVNAADRLAILLVAHRDPETLEWRDNPLLSIPEEVIPTDVPAWWMLKKKNAMFYNGFGRGDFSRFLMLSNLLTVKDTAEAREVYAHFADVLAYIKNIQPPVYPLPINHSLAETGKQIFVNNCSHCHGSYGKDASYPNLLIPAAIIQTDSLLFQANYQNPQFIEWFNKSWFAKGNMPAKLDPYNGYVAPPLDGIWATAPYLHNGSVPNLEAVLNSRIRPEFWKRNMKTHHYDTRNMACDYHVVNNPEEKNTYNTKKRGYSNSGHYFGDQLTDPERKALLEYLKTL
jgi:mono/diheme cytochrome c family protein